MGPSQGISQVSHLLRAFQFPVASPGQSCREEGSCQMTVPPFPAPPSSKLIPLFSAHRREGLAWPGGHPQSGRDSGRTVIIVGAGGTSNAKTVPQSRHLLFEGKVRGGLCGQPGAPRISEGLPAATTRCTHRGLTEGVLLKQPEWCGEWMFDVRPVPKAHEALRALTWR